MSQTGTFVIQGSLSELFSPLIEDVAKGASFQLSGHSHAYILSVLERSLFAGDIFFGADPEPMISEVLLTALQEEKAYKKESQLKLLGESILFKSGFFADSFKRKIIGLNYYINMGAAAYENLYKSSRNPVHGDLSSRFTGYVDLFSEIGSKINFKAEEDLITLFDRYLEAGSKGAEAKLISLGTLPVQHKKASNQ